MAETTIKTIMGTDKVNDDKEKLRGGLAQARRPFVASNTHPTSSLQAGSTKGNRIMDFLVSPDPNCRPVRAAAQRYSRCYFRGEAGAHTAVSHGTVTSWHNTQGNCAVSVAARQAVNFCKLRPVVHNTGSSRQKTGGRKDKIRAAVLAAQIKDHLC